MAAHEQSIPPIYSVPRFTTLIASLIVALGSGTNYVYSAYAPQLGARLGISHTQLNIVALAGNIGVYSSGPVWGRIVDTKGPRILLACAFVFLLGGYLGMRYLYDAGLAAGQTSLSLLGFCGLVLCCYLTGAGGNGGLTSSVNSTAKTFPDQMRATTTGIVISGFGLSAFLFSTISHLFYAGNTSSFLFLLAVGTALPMIAGFFLVRPIPLPPHEPLPDCHDDNDDASDGFEAVASAIAHDNSSHARLLDHTDQEDEQDPYYAQSDAEAAGALPSKLQDEDVLELSPQRYGGRSAAIQSSRNRSLSRGAAITLDVLPNLHGFKLWKSGDFYLLFTILSLLSGTGLMYINNVGSMSQALYAYKNPKYDAIEASRWQATQVSAISLMNFAGRIFIGLVSDFGKNRYGIPRSYCLVLSAFLSFVSQVVAANVDHIADLWIASSVLGLAYGSVFSLFPTVCLEWFGLPHFSENWGYLSMSPMLAGNLFALAFGRNFDAHEDKPKTSSLLRFRAPGSELNARCSQGLNCYVDSIYLTIAATLLSIGLSVWASLRDRRKIAHALRKKHLLSRGEVLWEDLDGR